MAKSKKEWPEPKYSAGPAKHLHALGVIALSFASFDRGMFDLYRIPMDQKGIPHKLTNAFYASLNEQKRMEAINTVFRALEKERRVIRLVDNLVSYFEWCWNVRNTLLHAELYPSIFARKETNLHLVKTLSKRTLDMGYLALDVKTIRRLADKIDRGAKQGAIIRVYLRYRDIPPSRRPLTLRALGPLALPRKLAIPNALKLSPRPHNPPKPAYLRQPFP